MDLPGRPVGRVEAFILDERLDQRIVGNGHDVLSAQTIGDRLVGVVSHMADVVDEIDDVLLVTATNSGARRIG